MLYQVRYQTDSYILLGVEQSELDKSLSSNLLQSLVGRTLLERCLKEMGVYKDYPRYSYGKHGKPFLSNYSGWHFSISHCIKAVVCVLSTKEIGIDVEVIDENNLELAGYVLNEREIQDVMGGSDPKRSFCQYWTTKESLLKCSGIGIKDDLKNILDYDAYEFKLFSESEYEICICQNKLI